MKISKKLGNHFLSYLQGDVTLHDGRVVSSDDLHETCLIAIRLKQLKLTKPQKRLMCAHIIFYDLRLGAFKKFFGLQLNEDDVRVARQLVKKGLLYFRPSGDPESKYTTCPTKFGEAWILKFYPEYCFIQVDDDLPALESIFRQELELANAQKESHSALLHTTLRR